jgi:hypothetical protein
MDLASWGVVRILEARFHPASKAGQGFVIVGMVVCDQHGATVESAAFRANSVKPFDSTRLLQKLEFLVASAIGDPFRSLSSLRSEYWSFVEARTRDDGDDLGVA